MPGARFGKAAMLSCTVENVRSPVANAEGVAIGCCASHPHTRNCA
jgi:hypothetical protein